MMPHVAHDSQHTAGNDVVVLTEILAAALPAGIEVWLAFGARKHFQSLAAHQMATCLGSQESFVLLIVHTQTGCDTVPAFIGNGNKTSQAAWNSFPKLTIKLVAQYTLLELAHAPTEISAQAMHIIKRFAIFMYN